MQVVFINECKSCEISNQMFFNVMFSFSKTNYELIMTKILQNKANGTILDGASTEPAGYLEPSQTFMRKHFRKKSSKKTKELYHRCST